MLLRVLLLFVATTLAGCGRERPLFVEANARAHVNMLADTIGSRPVGTPANARARAYIVEQLQQIGFEVRVQEIDAKRPEMARTTRVANIIGLLPGSEQNAVALVTHYDSSPYGPGAADAALGVGVALEAARVAAARADRRWSLFVLVTDGEEVGLMGAAGLVTDRAVMDRLQAYINLEAVGSRGVPILFETGPANAWIVAPWARHAPHPRGASYALEIYRRLPNDTDFSILKARDIPGLNLAAVEDSYAYHTDRDTADRLAPYTIRTMGENVVAILTAMQRIDIVQRSPERATFFDIGGTVALTWGAGTQLMLAGTALLLGLVAWLRLTTDAVRENGAARWVLMFAWAWLGVAAAVAGMVAVTWLLRSAREVYHPWYARPGRLFVLLMLVGVTIGWSMARAGQWLPRRAHPARHPALTWSVTLPAWLAATAATAWFSPAAGHLWALPLLAAGILLCWVPPRADALVRILSLVILGVSATFWLRDTHDLLRFAVAVMGRLAVITPVWIYAAGLAAAGLMIVPPLVAALATDRPGRRPWLMTSLLLLGCAAATAAAYVAPAYTQEEPLRRHVRALQEADADTALWEIASVEPGIDLEAGAPDGWQPVHDAPATQVPWGRLPYPFVLRTRTAPLGPPPIAVSDFSLRALPDGLALHLAVVPKEPGLTVSFVLPEGTAPVRSSLPGLLRSNRWTATFVAPPAEGIAWEAAFRDVTAEQLRRTMVTAVTTGVPGSDDRHRLPPWLPRQRSAWSATATWVVPATTGPAIAPVPPLR